MEIVAKLSERTGLYQKDVKLVLSALPKLIREELDAGHEVKLHNFVNILQVDGAARTMTHIKTKEKFLVPERKITKAKVGKFLK